MSFVFGAYLRSSGPVAACTAGSSMVSGLSTEFSNIRISRSQAATRVIKGAFPDPNQSSQMFALVHVNSVHYI
jgi:hypothetical protein